MNLTFHRKTVLLVLMEHMSPLSAAYLFNSALRNDTVETHNFEAMKSFLEEARTLMGQCKQLRTEAIIGDGDEIIAGETCSGFDLQIADRMKYLGNLEKPSDWFQSLPQDRKEFLQSRIKTLMQRQGEKSM